MPIVSMKIPKTDVSSEEYWITIKINKSKMIIVLSFFFIIDEFQKWLITFFELPQCGVELRAPV